MAQCNEITFPDASGELWASYEQCLEAEREAWHHYRNLSGQARAALTAWGQTVQTTARAYDEYAHRSGIGPPADTVTVSD